MKTIISLAFILAFTGGVFAQSTKSSSGTSKFKDNRDGKTYKTISIGSQTWMAENLAYKTAGYYSGTRDESMTFEEWIAFSKSSGCYAYDYDESNVTEHGYLYNWETAKKVCPEGWRLPTKEDFAELLDNYGGDERKAFTALTPGGESGFDATFDGRRGSDLSFTTMDRAGFYWSSTEFDDVEAYLLFLSEFKSASLADFNKNYGSSVRCIKE